MKQHTTQTAQKEGALESFKKYLLRFDTAWLKEEEQKMKELFLEAENLAERFKELSGDSIGVFDAHHKLFIASVEFRRKQYRLYDERKHQFDLNELTRLIHPQDQEILYPTAVHLQTLIKRMDKSIDEFNVIHKGLENKDRRQLKRVREDASNLMHSIEKLYFNINTFKSKRKRTVA